MTHLIFFSLEPGANGELLGQDRFPRNEQLKEARDAFHAAGKKIMVCFGGNGRSSGFRPTVRDATARANFIKNIVEFIELKGLDGVDLNWEYPGFEFGRGYLEGPEILADYKGLEALASGEYQFHQSQSQSHSKSN